MIDRIVWRASLGVVMLALGAASASAQSAIAGVVRDASGGVLPGVTVEAASPALIEKVRVTVTNDDGRYSIVDLRPGNYTVTFALAGFNTLVRSGLELPPSFNATVDAELKVGALEESITVSGAAPTIDVESVQRTTVISRDVLDALPTARNFAATGALAVGVRVNESNVGGARTGSQQRLTVHGSNALDTRVDIDGINMAAFGTSQNQHNDGMYQEFVVQTGALGADVAGGGVRMTLIPREGGNTFHGAIFGGYTGEGFQASNITPALQARGLSAGNEVRLIYDFNGSVGGPIQKDKLWFFGSYRVAGNKMTVVNSFMPDGSPGIFDQFVQNFSARATWQATARNKFSLFQDRPRKSIDREIESGWEPTRAAQRRLPTPYYVTAARWTSTISNQLLLQASWGANGLNREYTYQPGVRQERGTPAWYAGASRVDINRGTVTTALNNYEQRTIDSYYGWASSLNYTTGTHNVKVGLEDRYGIYNIAGSMNADLIQRYRDGVPDSVIVYNTPRFDQEGAFKVDMDLGAYAQDTWKLNRLTVNPGLRLYVIKGSIAPGVAPAGRFVPARSSAGIPHIMDFTNVAPRFGSTFDLTGNGRTVLKGSVNKYYLTMNNLYNRYNPLASQTETRNWTDRNGDDIAQDSELGAGANANFGAGAARRLSPDVEREYNWEYNLAIDRELAPGLSVTAAWFRREFYNQEKSDNLLIGPDDYTSFQTANPLTGEAMTLYNLNRAKLGQSDIVDTTVTDRGKRRVTFDGFEVQFTARMKNATLFGGWWNEKNVIVNCVGDDPNTFLYCDQSQLDIPYRHNFKLNGTYMFPYGVRAAATLQSYAGNPLAVNWTPAAGLFPGGRTQSVTVPLIAPGTKYMDRWNQVDMSVGKTFTIGSLKFDGTLDAFNVLNSGVVLNQNQAFGSSLDVPTEILQPRLLRLSAQFKF
ncbi:MAG TPA: carboxypeptidase regulatory-like domain-containing protein [Vicinamibacterales bacterium]|nr:carboxypeptidase regulatory-like domain-containing protein [Vicinamibacterales bacterium]